MSSSSAALIGRLTASLIKQKQLSEQVKVCGLPHPVGRAHGLVVDPVALVRQQRSVPVAAVCPVVTWKAHR